MRASNRDIIAGSIQEVTRRGLVDLLDSHIEEIFILQLPQRSAGIV